MENAWCCSCKNPVSVTHADSNLPCPVCGGTWYVYVLDQPSVNQRLDNAEALMCVGKWEAAVELIEAMAESGEITAADNTLYQSMIEWRRLCAEAAFQLTEENDLPAGELLFELTKDYDLFAATWVVENYKGLKEYRNG